MTRHRFCFGFSTWSTSTMRLLTKENCYNSDVLEDYERLENGARFFFERVHVLAANPCTRGWYACLTSEKSFCGIISQESRELNMAFYVFTFLHDYKSRSRLNCHEEELIFVKSECRAHPFYRVNSCPRCRSRIPSDMSSATLLSCSCTEPQCDLHLPVRNCWRVCLAGGILSLEPRVMHFNQVCLAPGEAMKTVILFSLEGGLSSNLDLPSLHSVEKFMSNMSGI